MVWRITVRILVLSLLLGVWGSVEAPAASEFTFAILGDRTGGAVEGVFEQVVQDVGFLDPDFIITVGDHIEGYLADSTAIEDEWDYIVGLLEDAGLPYHLTPGNHDIWDAQSRRIYIRRFGAPNTTFVYEGNLFVILDVSTEYKSENLPQQTITWLEDELSKADRYANTFVFYHKPFWCEDFSSQRPNLLHDIFRRNGVEAVFTGHYHRHFYTERDGIRYFGVTSSGGSLPSGGRSKGCFYSYLLARVEGDSLEVRLLEPGFGESPGVVTMQDAMEIAALESDAVEIQALEIPGVTLEGTAKVQIGIKNPGSTTLRDTARWIASGDWVVEPLHHYVEVPPGETGTMTAYLSNQGNLFPVPRLELSMAYGDGQAIEISKPLPLKRLLHADRREEVPELDGHLEDFWKRSPAEKRFFGAATAKAPFDSTSLWVCHDGEYIYLAVEALESDPSQLVSEVDTRDGFGGYDDYVLVLLEPEIGSGVFYQVAVNPAGTIFDKHIEICPFGTYVQDNSWDAPLLVGTEIYSDRWIAEVGIPIASLGPRAKESTRWGFNFRRSHKHLGANSDFQVPLWYGSDRLGLLELD
jgi:hypothetical protein